MEDIRKAQLQEAISTSKSWVEVSNKMGKSRSAGDYFKKTAEKLGLDYSNLVPSHMKALNSEDFDIPFRSQPVKDRLAQRRSAIGTAINWFLSNNYSPSIPVEIEKYDLVVESEKGFQKVQVKSSEKVLSNGNHEASLLTTFYNLEKKRYEQRAYVEHEVDIFFIECADGFKYIIPFEAVKGKQRITITKKYESFRVE